MEKYKLFVLKINNFSDYFDKKNLKNSIKSTR